MPGGWFTPSGPSGAALEAANQASQAASRGAFGALGIPPPAGGPPVRDDWRLPAPAASPVGATLRAAADGNPFDDPELGADLEQYLGIGRDAFETLPERMPGSPGYQPPVFETLPGRLPGSPGYQPPVFETLPYRRSPGRFGYGS